MTRRGAAVWAIAGLAIVGVIGLVVWTRQDERRARRERAAYLESQKPYAARVLEVVGAVPDELAESSGVAVSRAQPGVLWSHNDSGDGPNVYAMSLSGQLLATVRLTGAAADDWEDIAAGPCPASVLVTTSAERGAPNCLYLADIGDNRGVRDVLTVYVVVEPALDRMGGTTSTAAAQSFRYRYRNEPHDSEAFAVAPSGDVTIVTKDRSGTSDFFGLSRDQVAGAIRSGAVLTAELLGDTGITSNPSIGRLVTAAAVSPDGTTLAVRTYNEVFFFGAGVDGRGWKDLGRPCFLGPAEPQGEAIDYLDDQTLVLTSERGARLPGVIHRLQC